LELGNATFTLLMDGRYIRCSFQMVIKLLVKLT
jgi:hypothetical protein